MAGITERQIKKWGFTLPPGGLAALTRAEIAVLNKMQADTKYNPPEGALARLRASPTKPVDNITRGSVKKEKVTESSEEQPRSIAAAKRLYKKTGDNKYLFYQHDTGKTDVKGKPIYKKMAAVYKEDLKGLSLTEYLNKKMNLKPRTRKAPPLPKRKPQRKLSTKEESKVKAGLGIRDASAVHAGATRGPADAGPVKKRRYLSEKEETGLLDDWGDTAAAQERYNRHLRKKSDAKKSRTGNTDYRKGGLFY
jgi:hypothetical protein|tara:strand:- start:1851 stop:2603 length:753 start_codon:yes stop_codon:yes gene_type:complete